MFFARRSLQISVFICAFVPILAGLAGILLGPDIMKDSALQNPSMDSHFRYLSGLLMGIGLGFWTTIADIELKTARFRLLAAIVILGGIGRLYSLIIVGIPDQPMLLALIMELIIMPLLVVWQYAVARQSQKKTKVIS